MGRGGREGYRIAVVSYAGAGAAIRATRLRATHRGRATRTARRDLRSPLDGLGLARVEACLEVAPDALTAREHRFVANASRRELHDPHVLVAVAVAARVCGGLIEGPKAVALPLSPHVPGTPIRMTSPARPARGGRIRSLRQSSPSARSPAAAPWAPVATGSHEVAMSRHRLLARRRAVPEQLTFVRAHLEEAEILAVLRGRPQARFAPC